MNLKSSCMLILALIALSLITNVQTQTESFCGKGCLSCTDDNSGKCQVCDVFNFYVRQSDGSCTKTKIENCEVTSLHPERTICLLCEPGYVIDFVQRKCVAVHFSKLIDDCERYTSFSTCNSCNPENYMQNGRCVSVSKSVLNCEKYSTDGVCSECSESYFYDVEENTCSKFPKARNCQKYNRNKCDKCLPGYTKDFNFYLRLSGTDTEGQTLALSEVLDGEVHNTPDDLCFENNVDNCKVFSTPEECAECNDNYFLTVNFKCEKYPQNKIANCIIYENETSCLKCNELYYVDNGECKLRENLDDNCFEYKLDEDLCSYCSKEYFITYPVPNSFTCEKRSKEIHHCITYDKSEDQCEKCRTDFELSSNNLECFKKIDNCQTHIIDQNSTDFKKCQSCFSPYFLLDDLPQEECTLTQNVPYCIEKVPHTNNCNICEYGFYKDANEKCTAHTVKFCNEFEPDQNKCKTCIQGFILKNEDCVPSIKIQNCNELNSTSDACKNCMSGYFLENDGYCYLTNLVGCTQQTPNFNECSQCDEENGFKLNGSTKTCMHTTVVNCSNYNALTKLCENCESGYNLNQFGTCSKTGVDLSTCFTNDGTKCLTCEDDKYLSPITNECVPRNNLNCNTFDKFSDQCITCQNMSLINGECKTVTVDNCNSYAMNSDNTVYQCTDCNSPYYLNDAKTCQPQEIEGCIAYLTDQFGCSTCGTGYIGNDVTNLCESIFIPNCSTYSTSNFECETCEDSFYLGSDKRCYQYTMEGCATLNTSDPEICDLCMTGFTPYENKCIIPFVANCKTPSTSDPLICLICDKGYYLNSSDLCEKQKIDNCKKYVDNSNQCTLCENLYSINISLTCTPIPTSNCVESDGSTDACLICSPGYKRIFNICEPNSSNYNLLDFDWAGCLGNDNSQEIVCNVCKPGFQKAVIQTINYVKLPGCSYTILNAYGLGCNQCNEYFQHDTLSNGCKLVENYNGECIKGYTNDIVDLDYLDTNGNCEKCRDQNTHYLNNDEKCTQRTNIIPLCDMYNKTADSCDTCKEGYRPFSTSLNEFYSCTDIPGEDIIPNCLIYDFNSIYGSGTTPCLICNTGYYGDNCENYFDDKELFFDNKLNINYSVLKDLADPANAEKIIRKYDKDNQGFTKGIGSCKEGYTPFVNSFEMTILTLVDIFSSTYNIVTQEHERFANHYEIEECISNDPSVTEILVDALNDYDISTVIKEGNCAALMNFGFPRDYYCVACKKGFVSKVVYAEYQMGGNFIGIYPVSECVPKEFYNLEKKYQGEVYINHYFDLVLPSSTYYSLMNIPLSLPYDSCNNGKTPLAYLRGTSGEKGYMPGHFSSIKKPRPSMECVDIHSDYLMDGCQVYALISTGENHDVSQASVDGTVECLSCKPGYKKEFIETPGIRRIFATSCTLIDNCDLDSSENKYMNSCGICKENYSIKFNLNYSYFEFDECIESNLPNCFASNTNVSGPVCLVCKKGYLLNYNGECVTQLDTNCEEPGIQNFPIIGLVSNVFFDSMIYSELASYFESTYSGISNTSCNKCKFGTHLTTNVDNQCSSLVNYINPHCIKYDSTSKCILCEEGYISIDNVCVDENSNEQFKGCLVVISSSCIVFKFPYYKFLNFETFKTYPVYIENTLEEYYEVNESYATSIACQNGMIFDFFTNKCVPTEADDDCNFYICVSTLGTCYCLECKDPTKVAFTYNYHFRTQYVYKTKCSENFFFSKYVEKVSFVNFKIEDNGNPVLTTIDYDIDPRLASSSNDSYSVNKNKYFCIPETRKELNCKEYHEFEYKCISCPPEYYLGSLHDCVRGNDFDCAEYDDTTKECLSCKDGYFYDITATTNEAKCIARTVECLEYYPDADNCISCPENMLFEVDPNDSNVNRCVQYTAENCLFYSQIKDVCLICIEGFYRDKTDFLCKPISSPYCSVYDINSGTCAHCHEGFFLDSSRNCQPVTKRNCEVFSHTSDACLTCPPFFYLDETKNCSQIMIIGCEVPQVNQNKCAKCSEGYYMEDNICLPNNALNCSSLDPSENKCLTCDSTSYKNENGDCVRYINAVNCETFNKFSDECFTCLDNFYLNDDNVCVENTNTLCKEYSKTSNTCISCLSNYYLKNELCHPITAKNCLTTLSDANECESCSEDFYFDIISKNCVPYSVLNCSYYNRFENKCSSCKEGYYFKEGSCLPYTAKHCNSYSTTSNKCTSCIEGYYFDSVNETCNNYTISGCSSYNPTENSCISCPPDFYRSPSGCSSYTIENCSRRSLEADLCIECQQDYYFQKGKCIEYTAENCNELKYDEDICENCLSGYYYEFGECIKYTAENCLTYVSDKDQCLSCDTLLNNGLVYFHDNKCLFHTPVEKCVEYSQDSNQCNECELGYFIFDNKCLKNPTGIPNCIEYIDDGECSKCDKKYYLRDNICHQPLEEIQNCLYYLSENVCHECVDGFSPNSEGLCGENIETSCKKNKDPSNCQTCHKNEVLKKNDFDKLVCEDSGIDNCFKAVVSASENKCLECESGYFLKDGQCSWPESLVDNCKEYLDHGLCAQCESNHVLSSDNKTCSSDMSLVGDHCLLGSISDKPFCSRCEKGFLFNSFGRCVECSSNVKNCEICNLKDLNYCLICQKGYYMNDDRECIEYPSDDDDKNIKILSIVWMILVVFILA